MNGTPSSTESVIPGWYINFLAAVIKQLPRPGQIDETTADGWEKNQGGLKSALAGCLLPTVEPEAALVEDVPSQPIEKFFLRKKVNFTVPKDYKHEGRLDQFAKANKKKFYGYNDLITDANFAQVTHKLVPGKTYTVKIFGIASGQEVSSEECLVKCEAEKAYLVGAQGASVLWEEKRKELPKGYWHVSFDKKENLPVADGYHRVPFVPADSDGDFHFDLGYFERSWSGRSCLLCFCDEETSEPSTAS